MTVSSIVSQILTMPDSSTASGDGQEANQGKMLLHTEYSLLSLLRDQDGVVHHHGLFKVHSGFCIHVFQDYLSM